MPAVKNSTAEAAVPGPAAVFEGEIMTEHSAIEGAVIELIHSDFFTVWFFFHNVKAGSRLHPGSRNFDYSIPTVLDNQQEP